MKLKNNLTEYGLISKSFHWLSAAILVIQIPLGFYLVDMDFSEKKNNSRKYSCDYGFKYIIFNYIKINLQNI